MSDNLEPRDLSVDSPTRNATRSTRPSETETSSDRRRGERSRGSERASELASKLPSVAEHPLAAALLHVTDAGLAAVIFFAPLFMGGRHPLGRLVLVSIIGATAMAWFARQCFVARAGWNRSPAQWLIVAALALVVLQILPLPESLVRILSPYQAANLPLWHSGSESAGESAGRLGVWNRVSLAPAETRNGLLMLTAYGLLFVVVLQRLRQLADLERLLRWIAIAAMGMAALGLLQFFFGNSKFLWMYEHPFRTTDGVVKGSFSNQNHFAHFLALGIGPLVWWLQRVIGEPRGRHAFGSSNAMSRFGSGVAPYLIGGLLAVTVAGLLTFSRGGVISILAAAAVCVLLLARQGLFGRQALIGLGAVTLLVAAALTIHGSTRLATRLESLLHIASEDQPFNRRMLWNALLEAIPQYAVLGSGVGTHREVYPQYIDEDPTVDYTHAESGYLQLGLETGVPGLLLMLLGIYFVVDGCRQALQRDGDRRASAAAAAVFSGLIVSALHSLGDFVWYIPACISLAVILAACACRLRQWHHAASPTTDEPTASESEITEWRVPRAGWIGGCVCAGLLTVMMVQTWWGPAFAASPWESYRKLAREQQAARRRTALDTHEEPFDEMARLLEATVASDPADARAHIRLAELYRRWFEVLQRDSANAMTLTQIRDAAIASQFESPESLDQWLTVAIGPNREMLDKALAHTRRGLQLCPLQGEGYIYLAELAFLEGQGEQAKPSYINQALRLRPRYGPVLMAAGSELAMAGNWEAAIETWKRAYHDDYESQVRIMEIMAPVVPAEFFMENFRPDRIGMGRLLNHYRGLQRQRDVQIIGRRFIELTVQEAEANPAESLPLWMSASSTATLLDETQYALEFNRRAVQAAPNDFNARQALGNKLLAQRLYTEAVEQFKWCLSRAPNDEALRQSLMAATKGMHDGTQQPVASHVPVDPTASVPR